LVLNFVKSRLGRKLRAAVIGGGGDAQIAATHRLAMRFDDAFSIVAGVLSSDPERSMAQGAALSIDRPYPDLETMFAGEAGRDDRPDLVAIMTPNHVHTAGCLASLGAGYHVICDKPLANSVADATKIVTHAKERNLLLCVTHNYSGYPMVRQMRSMVRDGVLGPIHQVQVRYAQGNLGAPVPDDARSPAALRWRLDPARGGTSNLMLDVGTHAHQLLDFVIGSDFETLSADLGPSFADRSFDDTVMVFGRLSNGARASLIATKAATGAPQILDIEVYGSMGGLAWRQQDPQSLAHWQPGMADRRLHRAMSDLCHEAEVGMRIPRPHPEGFREAFANIYAAFGASVAARLTGQPEDVGSPIWPGPDYALRSLHFVEACIASSTSATRISVGAYRNGV
jgi:predicted dehydrogenase